MKAEATATSKPRSVVVWERKSEPQRGNVIALPNRNTQEAAGDRESVVQTWSVGPADNPAVVTQVSSGFNRVSSSVSSPQASRMSMAA
ncbi:hypothetical protein BRE01_51980 [Brevibacillus reuszeri]|uniref:Uncharacterized protein n=1 Tax=Brevibacillus reuszeri TaxID=54915 RepID=A0A0K9YLA9_9BACL|nr:hypothetical protein [Brevibacillus reuszeri]KNB68980.1 hypothetical protein ADS79_31155 [Brevibacillus reuszeri]MED1859389.1 hypothetical protein [Brevibacillus reuszeri]GED71496.1 hypothetical protein BRE01_51980 [Brevibacillus reuszeri]